MRILNRSPKAEGFVAIFILMAASLQADLPSSKASNLDSNATNEMSQNLLEKRTSEINSPEYSKKGCECVAARD